MLISADVVDRPIRDIRAALNRSDRHLTSRMAGGHDHAGRRRRLDRSKNSTSHRPAAFTGKLSAEVHSPSWGASHR
ncbi:hypothetical protein [Burkholderia lata]|uniref:hypothetical protein n=1 Tax=Burkholderia lata (strain ATCC 17760 / DSM 23089 / LMG 22485 / NCIMB 9086 / R18194 / 383) TaxID=482957 RepID=UPI0015817DA9|nr:hypothetical protein [Burkholderia lata]